jgi:hypothetical protein
MLDEPDELREPVDRARRFRFVSTIIGFSLLTSLALVVAESFGVFPEASALRSTYIDGSFSISIAACAAYVTGSVVDYNRGFGIGRSSGYSGGYPPPRRTSSPYFENSGDAQG